MPGSLSIRKISLLRHGDAGRSERSDRDRPLSPTGQADVISLAAELRRLDFVPDLLRTSDASRAHQTARILAGLIDYPLSRIAVEASLYLADREFLFRSIRETPADAHHLLLVGHNPGLSELWDLLSDHPGAGLPTCGLAEFEIESNDWGSIMPGTARLLCFRGAAPGSR